MAENRSACRVVYSTLESKFWKQVLPSADEVRPGSCPVCAGAAREPGRALGIVGHGLRDRQLRGPTSADAAPSIEVVLLRRYRCQQCRAILTVVPREVETRRLYSRPAIALALARMVSEASAAVRRAVCPWRIGTTTGWPTLRRWLAAVARGALFPAATASPDTTPAGLAARVAQLALGHAPPSLRAAPMLVQVFAGAVAMA